MKRRITSSCLWALGVVASLAHGPLIFAQHIHDNHPTTLHDTTPHGGGSGWQRTSLVGWDEDPDITITQDEWVYLLDHTFQNLTCQTSNVSVSETKTVVDTVTVTWTAGGAGTAEFAAGALFAKCKTKVGASLQRQQSWTASETISHTISESTTLTPCSAVRYYFRVREKIGQGGVAGYDHKITCVCSVCGQTAVNYCNPVQLMANGVGHGITASAWEPKPNPTGCQSCGGSSGGGGSSSGGGYP